MSVPLNTIPAWVPNIIKPDILFVTENYTKNPNAIHGNTFFYRSLHKTISIKGTNNLLSNICKTMGIAGADESEKLNNFLRDKNFFLIDTFPSGLNMSRKLIRDTKNDIDWIDKILDDLVIIEPKQIVLTCIGSNGELLPALLGRAKFRKLKCLDVLVHNPELGHQFIFNSPSNRQYSTFNRQIHLAIEDKLLVL